MKLKKKIWSYYDYLKNAKKFIHDKDRQAGMLKSKNEREKKPKRTDIINYLLSKTVGKDLYLEIGVRNPSDNFDHIQASEKYSVDPGLEFKENPVDFKMTSDEFFSRLEKGEHKVSQNVKFDVIFIDGLHLADQVDKDIKNALNHISEDGFIVLHDCNPPTEWHARENYHYVFTPAKGHWNGTTWKAFLKWRSDDRVQSCCIDTDWGVGILSKKHPLGKAITHQNPFYEYEPMANNREKQLNLISFETLKSILD